MTSFYYASKPLRGNWFHTNQPEHESDDRAGDTVTSVCVTNEKDIALQQHSWSTFVTELWCSKTNILNREIGSCEIRFLKFTDNFGLVSSKMHMKTVTILIPTEITWKKMARSVCLTPVSMVMWRLHTLWLFTVPAYTIHMTTYRSTNGSWSQEISRVGVASWHCVVSKLLFHGPIHPLNTVDKWYKMWTLNGSLLYGKKLSSKMCRSH